jgi:hypothetical protein
MRFLLVGLVLAAVAARGPCLGTTWSGTLNSDGSGSHPKDNVPYSTSQNVGYDMDRGLLRWQSTHWFFPGPPYRTVKRDVFVSLGGSPTIHFLDETTGVCRVSPIALPPRGWLSCVEGWTPWVGDCGAPPCDSHAIGASNVTTWAPAAQVSSTFPEHSLLADAAGQAWQLRVRENGHYRLLLSLENAGYDASFVLTPPAACANASRGPAWKGEQQEC